jgi:hypothetical protein
VDAWPESVCVSSTIEIDEYPPAPLLVQISTGIFVVHGCIICSNNIGSPENRWIVGSVIPKALPAVNRYNVNTNVGRATTGLNIRGSRYLFGFLSDK